MGGLHNRKRLKSSSPPPAVHFNKSNTHEMQSGNASTQVDSKAIEDRNQSCREKLTEARNLLSARVQADNPNSLATTCAQKLMVYPAHVTNLNNVVDTICDVSFKWSDNTAPRSVSDQLVAGLIDEVCPILAYVGRRLQQDIIEIVHVIHFMRESVRQSQRLNPQNDIWRRYHSAWDCLLGAAREQVAPDGPVPPSGFRYGGKLFTGLKGDWYVVVSYLWPRLGTEVPIFDLSVPLYGAETEASTDLITLGACRGHRRTANNFFKDNRIPLKISLNVGDDTISLIQTPNS